MAWGVGDFCGGLISRYSSVISAMLVSQLLGLTGALALLAASGEPVPRAESLAWAALGGLFGTIGLGCFYLALARGAMGLIAPLAALIAAAVPTTYAIVTGTEVGELRLAGIVVALIAVVLISLPGGGQTAHDRRALRIGLADLPLVVLSGLGFAAFFIFVDLSVAAGGETWWPIVGVRVVGLTLVLGVAGLALARARGSFRQRGVHVFGIARLRARALPLSVVVPLFLLTGLGDLGGNAFFVLANAVDDLPVAVVLSSLYPAVTTLLAFMLLRERLRPWQLAAVGLAVAGAALISVGALPAAP